MHIFNTSKCFALKYTNTLFQKTYVCLSHGQNFYFHVSPSCLETNKARLEKDLSGPYPSAYEPKDVERGWYKYWEENGFFKSSSETEKQDAKPAFSIVLPPPNVTGKLHIGHTLTATIQDCICRWRRMKGENVCWIPGYDHGGIATQTVVEKKLYREKQLTKHEIGKEDFIKEIYNWKSLTQKNIETQLKRLGSSLDFSQASFTMDENASKAVAKTFVQLFDEGLIFRKEKLVNWSCAIKSVISDIEVDHLEIPGKTKVRIPGLKDPVELGVLDYFYYPVVDSDEKLLVATSRLETMLADSAVAVNPNDNRYSHLVGKYVTHPYTGEQLPIISDQDISKEFGTGVMKVTPAHDFKDYELGERYKLKFTDVLSDEGMINADVENFKGQHRLIVRQLLRKSLAEKGLFKESKSHSMSIPFCSRTGDIVEPRLKDQWYLSCAEMGRKAVEAVEMGKLHFYPQYNEKVWFEWFKNLKDWCISRQLWWGHQIPAYKVYDSSKSECSFQWIAAANREEAVEKCVRKFKMDPNNIKIIQDPDVLDTWFSSALYPLTSLGWPTKTDSLEKLYPLSLMETGFDILFFWVARMVMLGEYVTGKLPFQEVLLHGMVCDSHGRKMTKSLGNTIDPLDIIEGISIEDLLKRAKESQVHDNLTPEEYKSVVSGYRHNFPNGIPECGTDGLRFSLLSHDIQNQKINIDVKTVRVCRHFCNKIWQGVRLFTKAIEPCKVENLVPLTSDEVVNMPMNDVDRWILSRLAGLVAVSNANFESHEFHIITSSLRQFWVMNFCDVYLEYVKIMLSTDESRRLFLCRVMLTCIQVFLHVLSPLMPYLSEELYQRLSTFTNIPSYSSISIAPYPVAESFTGWRNTVLEADMHTVTDLIGVARSLKAKHGVTKLKPAVTIAVEEEDTLSALNPFCGLIASLAKLGSVTFHLTQGQEFFEHQPQDSWVFQVHDHGITVIMDIGFQEMKYAPRANKLNKLDSIRSELDNLNKMLSHSGYRRNASLSAQEKTMAKKASLEGELQKLLNQYGKAEDEKEKDSSCS